MPIDLEQFRGQFCQIKEGPGIRSTREEERKNKLPWYTLWQIMTTPATKEELLPMVAGLTEGDPSFALAKASPLEIIQSGINTIVPDYTPERLIKIDQRSLPPSEIERLGSMLEGKAVDYINHSAQEGKKAGKEITELEVKRTTDNTKRKIWDLIGSDNATIGKTYVVGDVEATVVVPTRVIDPLYCLRHNEGEFDRTVNLLFESAFIQAFLGRVFESPRLLRNALTLGTAAGKVAFSSALLAGNWKLAELFFISEIVHGRDNPLISGFSRL